MKSHNSEHPQGGTMKDKRPEIKAVKAKGYHDDELVFGPECVKVLQCYTDQLEARNRELEEEKKLIDLVITDQIKGIRDLTTEVENAKELIGEMIEFNVIGDEYYEQKSKSFLQGDQS